MSDVPQILLVLADPALLATWRAALAQLRETWTLRVEEGKCDGQIDVLVADCQSECEATLGKLKRPHAGELGVILVDSSGPADVHLTSHASDREIQLAVRLLTEIVQLRRQQHRGARIRKMLSHLALSDPLTGLPNRRAWDEQLGLRIDQADEASPTVSLAVFDIDLFKLVNDRYGHSIGDEVLKAIAAGFTRNLREPDFVARLGGDEFGVLFAGLGQQSAASVVERVRKACTQWGTSSLPRVTLSAGLAVHRDEMESGSLFAAADGALRSAKHAGRDRTAMVAAQDG